MSPGLGGGLSMKHHAIFGSVALVCASLFITAAMAAEDCKPLQMATTTKLIGMSNRKYVPVAINGVPKLLLLDTGGFMSQLSRDSVDELKLTTHDGYIQLADASGNVSRKYVITDTLKLGTLTAQKQPMMVSPGNLEADGILSSDLLLRYDVEMDFAGNKLNYFLPDHCEGKVIYWHPDSVAAVPITVVDKSRLMVPVTLDGRKFNAIRRACKGDPENPVTSAELAVKARMHLVGGGMPGDEADRFIAAVNALTEDRPVAELGLFRHGGEPPAARRRSA